MDQHNNAPHPSAHPPNPSAQLLSRALQAAAHATRTAPPAQAQQQQAQQNTQPVLQSLHHAQSPGHHHATGSMTPSQGLRRGHQHQPEPVSAVQQLARLRDQRSTHQTPHQATHYQHSARHGAGHTVNPAGASQPVRDPHQPQPPLFLSTRQAVGQPPQRSSHATSNEQPPSGPRGQSGLHPGQGMGPARSAASLEQPLRHTGQQPLRHGQPPLPSPQDSVSMQARANMQLLRAPAARQAQATAQAQPMHSIHTQQPMYSIHTQQHRNVHSATVPGPPRVPSRAPIAYIDGRNNDQEHQQALDIWPASKWLEVPTGVRVRGRRLAAMQDGIIPTDVPHMFRLHSTSGQAEWWPTDLLSVLCGCPNSAACCSHLFGVAVAKEEYRPKMLLLLKARQLVSRASAKRLPIEPVIQQLATGLAKYLPNASVQSAWQVAAETAVALLLQEEAARPAHLQRHLWWRGGAFNTSATQPLNPVSTPPTAYSDQELGAAVLRACTRATQQLRIIHTADVQIIPTDSQTVQGEPASASLIAMLKQQSQPDVLTVLQGLLHSTLECLEDQAVGRLLPEASSRVQPSVDGLLELISRRDELRQAVLRVLGHCVADRSETDTQAESQAAQSAGADSKQREASGQDKPGQPDQQGLSEPESDTTDKEQGLVRGSLVAAFLKQALAASQAASRTPSAADLPPADQQQQMEEAACRQLGVQSFTDLACGSFQAVLQKLKDQTLGPEPWTEQGSQQPLFAHALLLAADLWNPPPATVRTACTFTDPPSLVWAACQQQHQCSADASAASTQVVLLGAGRGIVTLDTTLGDVTTVIRAMQHLDGVAAVHSLLSLLAVHGGYRHLPLELLTSSVQEALPAVSTATQADDTAHVQDLRGRVQGSLAQYTLDVVLSMPPPFSHCPQLLRLLLPHALTSDTAVVQAVLTLAQSAPTLYLRNLARCCVHEAGAILGVSPWADLPLDEQQDALDTLDTVCCGPGGLAAAPSAGAGHQEVAHASPQGAVAETHSTRTVPAREGQQGTQGLRQQGPMAGDPGDEQQGVTVAAGAKESVAALRDTPVAHAESAEQVCPQGRQHVSAAEARAVIEDIRQRQFGIGLPLSDSVAEVLAAQHARLRRALERLSADLYSQKVHLLQELLQNADDCTYSEDQGPATVGFWVGPSGLAMASNERGFGERDVRALCDVGASSKVEGKDAGGPGDHGQTGEKGIGFKSVFTITDRPHISSNGYKFMFDANDPSGIGMVLPQCFERGQGGNQELNTTWPRPAALSSASSSPSSWTTHVWLPVADRLLANTQAQPASAGSAPADSWSKVAEELVDTVEPALLLFLRRVQRLVLHDARDPTGPHVLHVLERVPTRPDSSVLEVQHLTYHLTGNSTGAAMDPAQLPVTRTTHRWLCGSHTLHNPVIPRRATRLHATTITVACPLPGSTATRPGAPTSPTPSPGAWNDQLARTCDVCAYLPVRSYGLPFAIQADWLVPSSREDILTGEAWNQLLREQVPLAFSRAVQQACADPELKHLWTRYLPRAHVAQGFFRPLCASIPTALRGVPCIPTASGALVPPSTVLLAPQAVLDLVPETYCLSVIGKHFAHASLLAQPPPGQRPDRLQQDEAEAALRQLGVSTFTATHLVQLLAAGMASLAEAAVRAFGGTSRGSLTGAASDTSPRLQATGVQWCQLSQHAWRVLALLEELLTSSQSAVLAVGPQKVLLSQLSGASLLPLVGGSWATPSVSLVVTPQLHELAQEADDQYEQATGGAGTGADTGEPAAAAEASRGVPGASLQGLTQAGSQDVVEGLKLPVVDVQGLLCSTLDPETRSKALHCLTARLHIKPTSPAHIVDYHVLPVLRSITNKDQWRTLLSCTTYLLEHQHLAQQNPDTAKVWRQALRWLLVSPSTAHPAQGPADPLHHTQPARDVLADPQLVASDTGVLLALSVAPGTGGDTAQSAAGSTWRLPPELHATMCEALHSTSCCLHPAYRAAASDDAWHSFLCDILRCGYTLTRPPTGTATDLAVLSHWLEQHLHHEAASDDGPDTVPVAVRQFWEVLDRCWTTESVTGTEPPDTHSVPGMQPESRYDQPALRAVLQGTHCLPVSSWPVATGSVRASTEGGQLLPSPQQAGSTVRYVGPQQGPWAASTPSNRAVLGSHGTVYVTVDIRNPDLRQLLCIRDTPSVTLVLQQLLHWSGVVGPRGSVDAGTDGAQGVVPADLTPLYTYLSRVCAEVGNSGSITQSELSVAPEWPDARALLAAVHTAEQGTQQHRGRLPALLRSAFSRLPLLAVPHRARQPLSALAPQPAGTVGGPHAASGSSVEEPVHAAVCRCQWVTTASPVFWTDPSPGAAVSTCLGAPPLASVYPLSLQPLFTDVLGIAHQPSAQHLLHALQAARDLRAPEAAWSILAHAVCGTTDTHAPATFSKPASGITGASLPWPEVLAAERLLPCMPCDPASPATHACCWVSTLDPLVYLWCPNGSAGRHSALSAATVHRLLSAAAAEGPDSALHVLSPRSQHCSTQQLAALSDWLARRLRLPTLDTVTVQHLVDHTGTRLDPDALLGTVMASVGCDSRVVPLAGGQQLRLDLAAELTAAVPVLLQWLAAREPAVLAGQPQSQSAGAKAEAGAGVQGTPDWVSKVAERVQHLLVVSAPGLQDQHRILNTQIQTQASTCEAVLVGPLSSVCADSDGWSLLLVNARAGTRSPAPHITVATRQHMLSHFMSLVTPYVPLSATDTEEVVRLLLLHHSLSAQPSTEVQQTLQAMFSLPPLPSEGATGAVVAAAVQSWIVSKAWLDATLDPVQHTAPHEQPGVQGPSPSTATAPAPGTQAPAHAQQHTHPGVTEAQSPEDLPPGWEPDLVAEEPDEHQRPDAVTDAGHGYIEPALPPGAAHGFEVRPTVPFHRGGATPGAFLEEVVEVPAGVRVPLSELPVRDPGDSADRERRSAVGLWGEQFVAQVLRDTSEPGVEVVWVNEQQEQCLPYDLLVRHPDGSVQYIEVKTSTSKDKMYFEISHNEWLFAQREGAKYALYRVFGAGSEDVALRRIVNPYLQWRTQRVGLCLAL